MLHRSVLSVFFAALVLPFIGCATARTYVIDSNPSEASVKIDGSYVGKSPTEQKLVFGKNKQAYEVAVEKDGFVPRRFSIPQEGTGEYFVNEAEKKSYLKVPLDPIITFKIGSNPEKATVKIDGTILGETPMDQSLEFTKNKASYKVEFSRDGFVTTSFVLIQNYRGEFHVSQLYNKSRLMVTLAPITKKLEILSDPPNARIFIDDVYVADTPQKVKLTYGEKKTVSVKLVKFGYVPEARDIPISYQLGSISIDLKESASRKMAYIESHFDKEKNRISFRVKYEEAYKDAIEKSPNALQVMRIVQADNVNELFGTIDISDNYLAFAKSSPKNDINTEGYILQVDALTRVNASIAEIINGNLALIDVVTGKESYVLTDAVKNKSLLQQLYQVLDLIKKEKKIDPYKTDLIETQKKLIAEYSQMTDLSLEEISAELWAVNLGENFRKSKVTYAEGKWFDTDPIIFGKSIYFASNRNSKDFDIWRVSLGSNSGLTRITNAPYSQDVSPSINRDGTLLAYASLPAGAQEYQIWTVNPDGTLPSQLKNGQSPKICGAMIVFARRSLEGKSQIWAMKTDGSSETLISMDTKSDDFEPSVSPDCKRIVFTSNASGNNDICTMKIDGSERTQLTTNPSTDIHPSWGMDGNIYFVSNRGLLWSIWRLKPGTVDTSAVKDKL